MHNNINCFSSFRNNLTSLVKNHYFGIACKLRGQGKLISLWFDFIDKVIDYGTVAMVEFGDTILLARITCGYKNRKGGWTNLKVCFFGDKETEEFVPFAGSYVIFQWGSGEPFSLGRLSHDIEEIWRLKGLIGWDQDKSKKRITIEFERDLGKDGWIKPMTSYEKGFIGIISPDKLSNPIKKWEYFESKNSIERENLRKDLDDAESRFFLHAGIRHNLFSKEERQNNPEAMAGQALFYAWEVKHQEGLVNGILDFQEKPWGGGEYLLQFGNLPTLEIRKGEVNYLEDKTNDFNKQNLLNSSPRIDNMTNEKLLAEFKKEKIRESMYK